MVGSPSLSTSSSIVSTPSPSSSVSWKSGVPLLSVSKSVQLITPLSGDVSIPSNNPFAPNSVDEPSITPSLSVSNILHPDSIISKIPSPSASKSK